MSDYRFGQDVGRTTENGEASGAISSWKGQKKEGEGGKRGKEMFWRDKKMEQLWECDKNDRVREATPPQALWPAVTRACMEAEKEGSTEEKYSSFSLLFPSDLLPVPPTAQSLFKAAEPRDLHDKV